MSDELRAVIKAARLGAKQALIYFGKADLSSQIKADRNPVTKADQESEEVIKKYLFEKFPQIKFVGEESGGNFEDGEYWLVDPLDSTHNFIRQIPFWGVFIAFIKDGETTIGVSYIPLLDEMLYAEKGKGAFKNGKRIQVSRIDRIEDSYFSHSTLYKIVDRLPGFIDLSKRASKMRGFGDIYGFHLVATGKAEGMIDGGNDPWDVAAIKLIIEEAGGKVTTFQGEEWTFERNDVIATNSLVHDNLVQSLNKGY